MSASAAPLIDADGGVAVTEHRKGYWTQRSCGIAPKICVMIAMIFGFALSAGRVRVHMHKEENSFASAPEAPKCYQYTGGTCNIFDCHAERKATCTDGLCMCQKGCVGADGNCHSEVQEGGYELVASSFRLKNVKYEEYMYTPDTWYMQQLRVSDKKETNDLWNLYKLPGDAYYKQAKYQTTAYFLSSVKYPDYMVGMWTNKIDAGSIWVADVFRVNNSASAYDPAVMMTTLCRPKMYPRSVRMDALGGAISYYIHHLSWLVFGWMWSDPGPAGYWTPEPAFNFSVDECP